MNAAAMTVVIVFGMIFGMGAIAIILEHFQKMAKYRVDSLKKSDKQVMDAIDALRQEVADLRDTTTKYDLSFDTALQRLDQRMAHMEQRVSRLESEGETAQVNRVSGG